jgi:hypothetical protein
MREMGVCKSALGGFFVSAKALLQEEQCYSIQEKDCSKQQA